jgi:hypothetical protein
MLKVNLGKRTALTSIIIIIAASLTLSSFFYLNSKLNYSGTPSVNQVRRFGN